MKRILTLALLATTALSVPALAEDSSARSGLGLGVGADVGINADVGSTGVGADVNTSSDTNVNSGTMNSQGATMNRSGATFDADADTNINAEVDAEADTTTTGRTATGNVTGNATNNTSASGSTTNSNANASSSTGMEMRGENLARNDIILIQQALRQEGLYQGTADGVWGPRTASALMQFQQRNQLGATGQLSGNTLERLGVELGSSTSGAASNNQTTIENSVGVGATATPGSAGTY